MTNLNTVDIIDRLQQIMRLVNQNDGILQTDTTCRPRLTMQQNVVGHQNDLSASGCATCPVVGAGVRTSTTLLGLIGITVLFVRA